MASQTRSAGLGSNIAKLSATIDWGGVTNIYASDDSDAYAHPIPNYIETKWLRASTFGFTIPDGATIGGIVVEIEKACTKADMVDWQVKILRAGAEAGDNKAKGTDWPSSDTYLSYGGSTDKWGWGSWTPAIINATNFGVSIAATYGGVLSTAYARVDHIRITVYYTEAVGTNMKINIGDVMKDVSGLKINVGDSWKVVTKIQINIGDVWKTVFG